MKRSALTLQLLIVVFLVMYQSNPDFQAWCDYQMMRAAEWTGYAGRWLAWRLRRRVREVNRERQEDYGVGLET